MDPLRLHFPSNAPRLDPRPGGEFVLYWLQSTMRSHENTALTTAVDLANQLRLPVLVYQGLRHDYPWASDRLHTFILESVIDLADRFAKRGIQYAFHLDPGSDSRPPRSPLIELADRAALVVTDWTPTFIAPRQIRSLRRRTVTPVIAVDSTTVVPVAHHDRDWPTARGIRPRLLAALPHYLHPVPDADPLIRLPIDLPFTPDHPTTTTIPALVAQCPIDHTVPPSPTIRGGMAAAEARLDWFVEHGLPRYEEDRNDPMVDATSRLSAHLHFGTIAIQRVLLTAREGGPEPQYARFLDEALVWRELAHNFVSRDSRHRTLDALPAWARQELLDHAADPRPALYDEETLDGGHTGDSLWNACQRSLRQEGELHNWLRMLWGKSVLQWTEHPADALRLLEHFNNRYSLDGRDANSYGGILWCFGKFDRPFYRRPVYGTVRYMSLTAARRKFDAKAFEVRSVTEGPHAAHPQRDNGPRRSPG